MMNEYLGMNPVVKFNKQMKQKRKEQKLEAHKKQKIFEKQKQEKLEQKQQKQQKKVEEDKLDQPIISLPPPAPPSLPPPGQMIKVPGYQQMFQKRAIEQNRQYLDPNRPRIYDEEQQHKKVQIEQQNFQSKGSFTNSDGVIITDEVLKMLGPGVDPSKIKIGNKQKQQSNNLNYYDPFQKVTEQMNFDYVKNLEEQKNPKLPQPQIEVEQPKKKIFLKDDEVEKKQENPDLIIKESTVKKSKIDLNKQATVFIPPQLLKPQTQPKVIQQQQVIPKQIPNQLEFKEIINKTSLDQFFNEINKL
ncbi:hypothetical protein pb186bvf_009459 [Paramecium bursaria]